MSWIMAGVEYICGASGPRCTIPIPGVVVMVFSCVIPTLRESFMSPPFAFA